MIDSNLRALSPAALTRHESTFPRRLPRWVLRLTTGIHGVRSVQVLHAIANHLSVFTAETSKHVQKSYHIGMHLLSLSHALSIEFNI